MDFEAARRKMVDNQIRTTDVTGRDILHALSNVPREEFVPSAWRALAYIDEDVPVGNGRFLMEPSPFAKLLQLASPKPSDVVLDVGCGTGYSAAVLSHLASSVVALESDAELARIASDQLSRLDFVTCSVVEGPLVEGYRSEAPFDLIFFEGAVQQIPDTFFEQLKVDGRLVAVEGVGNAAMARLYLKEPNGILSDRFGFNCSLKPLPGFEKAQSFVF